MPLIVATYVYASSQGQRTHSAWTNVNIFYPVEQLSKSELEAVIFQVDKYNTEY